MKNYYRTFTTIVISSSFLLCKAQDTTSPLPKIENYTKGELTIMVVPFGLDGNEIEVGKVTADGAVHFNWPEIDVNTIEDSDYFMKSIAKATGMTFCNDKQIDINNEEAKAVAIKNLFLHKYGQQVGSLYPATKKEIEDNSSLNRHTSLVLGSTISWIYSDSDVVFNAKCIVNAEWENSYNFKETTNYNIHLKKGWNIVQRTLLEKEDWKNSTEQGSLPKTISKKTMVTIPSNINWYLKYWANDEKLEKRHRLSLLTPISEKQFEKWVPKKTNDFKRIEYKINGEIDRSASKNNITLIFEKDNQKIELTIIDGAESPDDLEMVHFAFDMDDQFNNDNKQENTSSKEEARYISKYDKSKKASQILYAVKDRLVVMAKGDNMTAEKLWEFIKTMNIRALIKN